MKKKLFFAFVGAIALSGAVGITSCTDKDVAEENPNYNPSTGDVAVDFVFNVSTSNTPSSTRMSGDAVQANDANHPSKTSNAFRGINNARLLSTVQGNDGKYVSAATDMGKIYDLAQVLSPGTITSDNSKRVLEMALPINTNSLMFYGKAIAGTPEASEYRTQNGITSEDVFGKLKTYNVDKDLSKVFFETEARLTGDNVTKYSEIIKLLGGMLTCIMYSDIKDTDHKAISATAVPSGANNVYAFDVTADEYPAVLKWSDYVNANNYSPAIKNPNETGDNKYTLPLAPLEQKLADVYKAVTTIKPETVVGEVTTPAEMRSGSAFALKRTIQDLWNVINDVRCALPLNKQEAVAKYFASLIHARLDKYFSATISNGATTTASVTGVQLENSSVIISAFNSDTAWPSAAGSKPTGFDDIGEMDLNTFPHNFKLPEGVTHLVWDKVSDSNSTKIFKYKENFDTSGMGNQVVTVENYYYSPELLYFGNSPIRVSDQNYSNPDYPGTSAKPWETEASWSADWQKNKHVISSTRSVAMVNNINYGTSLLKTQVGYKFESGTKLYDNNAAIQSAINPSSTETDKELVVDDSSFQLVGIIIGGQTKAVGWDYIRRDKDNSNTDVPKGLIYDMDIASTSIPTSGTSEPNYTLCFDNYTTAATQEVVYVALEFVNNKEDFMGMHDIIPYGGHFYLIGALDPTTAANKDAITWPTNHPLPPYYQTGETPPTGKNVGDSKQVNRVFMQDYMTSVTFKIGKNSLKYAYLSVPDLRSSSLTLGLSVDVSWSTGLNFSEVILGGK